MKVLIVEPGQYPREAEISGDLKSMQEIVGGPVEAIYPWEDRVALVYNDKGKLMGLPLNRSLEDYDIIVGTFFICGLGDENFASLSDQQLEMYKNKFWQPELFFITPDGIESKPCEPVVYRLFAGAARSPEKDETSRER